MLLPVLYAIVVYWLMSQIITLMLQFVYVSMIRVNFGRRHWGQKDCYLTRLFASHPSNCSIDDFLGLLERTFLLLPIF